VLPKKEKMRDAIFLVTKEQSCPYYSVGDELKVENASMSVSAYKPCCLYLADKITQLLSARQAFAAMPTRFGGQPMGFGSQKSRHDCGGCIGMVHFEYKQEKDYATLQMKLLVDAEEQRRKKHLERFFELLRGLPVFDSLDDESLVDLTLLLELKTFVVDKIVVKKGEPGTYLYFIVKGRVTVIDDDGAKGQEMVDGDIFGEMSLFSGEPVAHSIHTLDVTQLAMLSAKNFRIILKSYPSLQIFLFRMLVERAQAVALMTGNITSGMNGNLADISVIDLFQLINSSAKSGTVELLLPEGRAMVYFIDGEIVRATYQDLIDKDAFFAMVGLASGRFIYTRRLPKEFNKLEPIGGFMGLAMEGLQRIDENPS
jgi:CRP/FNR family cyclic AMP-dependent transcriptional regulator